MARPTKLELIVPDASVIVKWFLEEDYSAQAQALQEDYANGLIELAVPSLLPYEVLNALRYSQVFGESELTQIAQLLEDYQFVTISPRGGYAQRTIERALHLNITVYDAAYLAIGDLQGCRVYTADDKLLGKLDAKDRTVMHIQHYTRRSPTP